ncbi:signal peptide peptidase SppA [Leptospira idonii]|uniref:Signal peptide peptidase SppA n=1 Tax=Leptospira idonii TaxID=1193500 RepID=A0A4R9M5L3_9LEPT|nr:signal peptide peptidase SppA [Leptospira idonii]TGN20018.1 signal peptide peptidase SppA [Leptospira idonii]
MPSRKHFLTVFTIVFTAVFLQSCIIASFPVFGGGKADFEEKVISGTDKDKILIIPIEGIISDESKESFFGGSTESVVARVKESLKFAERDPFIKGVILKINSPGGTVTASDIIYQEILNFKQRKRIPVFAGFMDTAASGAYYIAMSTDSIGAHPTTVTGSVGVIMQGFNFKEGLDKIGVKDQSITSGANKAIGSPFIDQSPEQKKILQSIVDNLYHRFFQIVKKGRPNVPETRLKEICDGRIFTAEQAKNEGMVDFIGYFEDFQYRLMQHDKYSGDKSGNPKLIVYQRGKGRVENIYQANGSSENQIKLGIVDKFLGQNSGAKFYYLWDL